MYAVIVRSASYLTHDKPGRFRAATIQRTMTTFHHEYILSVSIWVTPIPNVCEIDPYFYKGEACFCTTPIIINIERENIQLPFLYMSNSGGAVLSFELGLPNNTGNAIFYLL